MTVQERAAADPQPAPAAERVWSGGVRRAVLLLGLLVAAVALAVTLAAAGAFPSGNLPGLPATDNQPLWVSAFLRTASTLLAVLVVGWLLGATVLAPGKAERLSLYGAAWLRWTRWAAAVWLVVTLASMPFRLAAILGTSMDQVSLSSTLSFALNTDEGNGFLVTAVAAAVIAVSADAVSTLRGAYAVLVVAVVGVTPPAFTGHAASSGSHQLATSSLLVHVLGVTLWVGGLVALFTAWRMRAASLAAAAARFSRLAGWCLVAVGVSGVVNALTRLDSPAQLLGSTYGRLVLLKSAAFAALALLGLWHRRRTLGALAAGRAGAFVRLAGAEVLVMAATVGLGVALSDTPTPPTGEAITATEVLLGYPMPPPLSFGALFRPYPDIVYPSIALVAIGVYLAGVRRLHGRGIAWSRWRTASWVTGWVLVLVVTTSGLARYGAVLTSVHMVQHMVLSMLAPVFLVLGGPLTLALRALHKATEPGVRGPREWLARLLRTRTVRFLSRPIVALVIYLVSLYGMYYSGLYELALRSHVAHLLMFGHFLAVGFLFFWVIIGVDPAPGRASYPMRVLLLLLWIALHTVFALSLMQSGTLLASGWFDSLERPWGASPLRDQQTAGGIAWAFGDIPLVLIVGALVMQWVRSDESDGRRLDRAAERARQTGRREDDPHERYNDYLRTLHEADRR